MGACALSRVAGLLAVGALVACNPPMAPNPPGPPPPPPPVNTPPVITSLAATRSAMETTESILVAATVEDQESGHDRLTFLWSSPAGSGTFVATGVDASWQAAADLATPVDIPLTLTVVESYEGLDAQGELATLEHRVSRSVTVRVHNSVKELGDMGLSFLEKFANSSLSPDECLVDFSDNCSGKQSEREDIERNREHYLILDWELGTPSVTNLSKYNRADIAIPCSFQSAFVKCSAEVTEDCVVGEIESVSGTCRLTAVYEQARWWLCSSRFSSSGSLSPMMRSFFGSDADSLP
jgi:hypothetical protein